MDFKPEIITQNEFFLEKGSLFSGLIAAIVYIVGFVLTGVIADPNTTIPTSLASPVALASSNDILALLLLIFYDILVIFFGLVIYAQFTTIKESKFIYTGFLLIALGVLGFFMIIFPGNESGAINLIIATANYILTLASIIVGGYFSKEAFETSGFLVLSIILLILLAVTGAYGFFILWLGILSYILHSNRTK